MELERAIKEGRTKKVMRLIYEGADEANSALIDAATYGRVKIMKLLLNMDQYADTIDDAMVAATSNDHLGAIKLLFRSGANLNNVLCTAASTGNTISVEIMLALTAMVFIWDNSPLHLAVEGGYIDTVEVLLDAGADVTSREYGALRTAVDADMVQLLLMYAKSVPEFLFPQKFIEIALTLVNGGFWHKSFQKSSELVEAHNQLEQLFLEEFEDPAAFKIFSDVYSRLPDD